MGQAPTWVPGLMPGAPAPEKIASGVFTLCTLAIPGYSIPLEQQLVATTAWTKSSRVFHGAFCMLPIKIELKIRRHASLPKYGVY